MTFCCLRVKRLAASDIEDGSLSDSSESSGTAEIASASGDRKTLEAQFKLLYRENLKLDKAYGDLQVSLIHGT